MDPKETHTLVIRAGEACSRAVALAESVERMATDLVGHVAEDPKKSPGVAAPPGAFHEIDFTIDNIHTAIDRAFGALSRIEAYGQTNTTALNG